MQAERLAAYAVHLLTASGAVCGLVALDYAAAENWRMSFVWLGIAMVIDAIDGPIARRVQVDKVLPRFSGATLDLVVDYLTYCVVPAFILIQSGRIGETLAPIAGAIILLTSLFHFADLKSKTEDGFFVGFPAIWNVVCLYVFVFNVEANVVLPVIVILAGATLIPIKWVHPVRSKWWRAPTLVIVFFWSLAALYEVVLNFPGTPTVRVIFAIAAVYLVAIGAARTFHLRRTRTGT